MCDATSDLDNPLSRPQLYHNESQTLSHAHHVEGVTPSFSYPRLRSVSPEKCLPSYQSHGTLAERRNHPAPTHLVAADPQSAANPFVPPQMDPEPSTPKAGCAMADYEWDSESVYSRDNNSDLCISPLKVSSKIDANTDTNMGEDLVLQGYHVWKRSYSRIENTANPPSFEYSHPESSESGLGPGRAGIRPMMAQKDALYSPLTPFFVDKEETSTKKGSKIMFGQNGWLEKTGQTPEKKKDSQKRSMFEGVKKMARGFVSDLPCPKISSPYASALTMCGSF